MQKWSETIEIVDGHDYTETPLHGPWESPVAGDAVMSRNTYFVQECPTCGRKLQVRVQYLGKQVICQHCGGQFEAYDASTGAYPPPSSSLSVLARAEELLQSVAGSIGNASATSSAVPVRPR
jgi:predicted RNA-binding Zn-ribbon protein involved in translation (DUF1610 family)